MSGGLHAGSHRCRLAALLPRPRAHRRALLPPAALLLADGARAQASRLAIALAALRFLRRVTHGHRLHTGLCAAAALSQGGRYARRRDQPRAVGAVHGQPLAPNSCTAFLPVPALTPSCPCTPLAPPCTPSPSPSPSCTSSHSSHPLVPPRTPLQANRWLGLRVETLGVVIASLAALTSVLGRVLQGPSASTSDVHKYAALCGGRLKLPSWWAGERLGGRARGWVGACHRLPRHLGRNALGLGGSTHPRDAPRPLRRWRQHVLSPLSCANVAHFCAVGPAGAASPSRTPSR